MKTKKEIKKIEKLSREDLMKIYGGKIIKVVIDGKIQWIII